MFDLSNSLHVVETGVLAVPMLQLEETALVYVSGDNLPPPKPKLFLVQPAEAALVYIMGDNLPPPKPK